jgi:hypothetical protein
MYDLGKHFKFPPRKVLSKSDAGPLNHEAPTFG